MQDVMTPGTSCLLVNIGVYQETVAALAAVTYSSEQCGSHCFRFHSEFL